MISYMILIVPGSWALDKYASESLIFNILANFFKNKSLLKFHGHLISGTEEMCDGWRFWDLPGRLDKGILS